MTMLRLRSKVTLAIAAITLTAAPAFAAGSTPSPTLTPIPLPKVTGVSATWATRTGFIVDWAPIGTAYSARVKSFTVTASNGAVCTVTGYNATECVYSNGVVPFPFKPYIRNTFTVTANGAEGAGPASAPSNAAGWFGAPAYPKFITTKTISDNEIDVKWIPDASTGGIPLTGYKVYYWPLADDHGQKAIASTTNSAALTGLTKSTWYVIAIQSCNFYGCSTSDWAFQATTPAAASTSTRLLPSMINGGNASTACWDAVLDLGGAANATQTWTKASTKCPTAVPPSTWPQVDATATNDPNLPIATKFNPRTTFSTSFTGFSQYSMSYKWNDTGLDADVSTRSNAPRTYTSLTPTVCTVFMKNLQQMVHFNAVGTCTVQLTIPEDATYLASGPLTVNIKVVP